jgi:hypothetical protein
MAAGEPLVIFPGPASLPPRLRSLTGNEADGDASRAAVTDSLIIGRALVCHLRMVHPLAGSFILQICGASNVIYLFSDFALPATSAPHRRYAPAAGPPFLLMADMVPPRAATRQVEWTKSG